MTTKIASYMNDPRRTTGCWGPVTNCVLPVWCQFSVAFVLNRESAVDTMAAYCADPARPRGVLQYELRENLSADFRDNLARRIAAIDPQQLATRRAAWTAWCVANLDGWVPPIAPSGNATDAPSGNATDAPSGNAIGTSPLTLRSAAAQSGDAFDTAVAQTGRRTTKPGTRKR